MQLYKLNQGNDAVGYAPDSQLTIHNGVAIWTGHISLVEGSVYDQTCSICRRFDAFLPEFGQKKQHILHCLVFLRDIDKYSDFIRAWSEWFTEKSISPPALTCVEAELAPGYDVEISLIVGYSAKGDCQCEKVQVDNSQQSIFTRHDELIRFGSLMARASNVNLKFQLNDILEQYDELFGRYGLNRANILSANFYLREVDRYQELVTAWESWTKDFPPALIVQQACPPLGKDLAVAITLAENSGKPIYRIDSELGQSLCVQHNGVAYFSGITSDRAGTASEEGIEVFSKINATMNRLDMKLDNIYFCQMFGRTFDDFDEFAKCIFTNWSKENNVYPSAIGFASPPPTKKRILVAITAAY